jgi:NAD(P)-dependent dehydrogenase (short-subunit alcohol dehydrogenase family)
MSKLHGKIALITSGSTGIGLATAEQFLVEALFMFILLVDDKMHLDNLINRISPPFKAMYLNLMILIKFTNELRKKVII